MKKKFYALCATIVCLSLCFTSKADSGVTNTVCFNDGFYNWKITYTDAGDGMYSASGSLNVDGVDWRVSGWGKFANHAGTVEFHAANPNADGCNSGYTDSFTYYGTAQITGNGQNTTFTGSGDWVSYCGGGVYSTGTWGAYGPCNNSLKSLPYGPAKHNATTDKKSSNSVCFNDGFYNWKITYTDHGTAQITGNGQNTTFTGSGDWVSYCGGGVYSTGTWAAYGPCDNALKSLPYGPAKHNATTDKKSSNSVCFNDGFYNWKITYTDQGSGNYSVTGSLNVDGVDWRVSGWGSFANHMGTVEFHAANPNADGCNSGYTDSFTYYGTA